MGENEHINISPKIRERLDELKLKLQRALEEDKKLRLRLPDIHLGPGAILLVPGADPTWFLVGLTWHRDSEDLLFCVPADDAPFVGATDVPTSAASFPVTLRCGYGIWITRPLLNQTTVVGEVSIDACSVALDRVEQLHKGSFESGLEDDDVDLQEWYDRTGLAVEHVARIRTAAE